MARSDVDAFLRVSRLARLTFPAALMLAAAWPALLIGLGLTAYYWMVVVGPTLFFGIRVDAWGWAFLAAVFLGPSVLVLSLWVLARRRGRNGGADPGV